jgi:hypothetical protein
MRDAEALHSAHEIGSMRSLPTSERLTSKATTLAAPAYDWPNKRLTDPAHSAIPDSDRSMRGDAPVAVEM